MRHLATLLALSLLASSAAAQPRGDWTPMPDAKGCIGGKQCGERQLTVPLRDLPVVAVRFRAHDEMGQTAGGKLRVRIDRNTIRDYIDIPRKGETFTIEVDELRGRTLVFEPAADDEVVIDQVAVLYGRERTLRPIPRDRDRDRESSQGWTSYRSAGMCIGGDECRKNGNRIMIALENAPVLGIRFRAHDSFGTRADGRLTVRIDDTPIESYIDVKREGRRHELEVDNIRGSKLVIQTANDDEVEVSDIEVLYGRRGSDRGRGSGRSRELLDEGACIGGAECGGRRNRIRIPLRGRNVISVRFYARDDVGTRASGELRIRVDDQILQDYLDIPRDGKNFTIEGRGLSGDYLIIEPAADDEVVVKDVRVRVEEW